MGSVDKEMEYRRKSYAQSNPRKTSSKHEPLIIIYIGLMKSFTCNFSYDQRDKIIKSIENYEVLYVFY